MASIAAEQFKNVFNTLKNIKKEIAATKTSIDLAYTNEEWDKLGPLGSRMQDLQGRKVSAETALTLLKNPVAVPSSNSEKEQEETEPNCCVCMVNSANAIAIPCGHLCCCLGCFKEVSKRSHKCPICRGTIDSIQKVIQSVTRNTFKTVSHSLAEGFSGMGITSQDARAALDAEAGDVSDAGRRLFQLATDRTNSARMVGGGTRVGGGTSTGETKEQSGLSESDIIARVEAAGNKITKNYDSGNVSVCQMEGGKRHGYGTYTFASGANAGDKYVGEWKNGKKDGYGTYTYASGRVYVGEFKNGKANGQGTETDANGNKYVREWMNDKKDGNGTYTWANGRKYVGEYKYGKMDGNGTYTYASGRVYVGEFKDNKANGQGTETDANGTKYVGEWMNDKRDGNGTLTKASGSEYVGEWKNGKMNGNGTYTYASGRVYVGEFKDNKANGQGTETYSDGTIFHSGEWVNDQPKEEADC